MEEALRKELRDMKKALAEDVQQSQKKIDDEAQRANQSRNAELDSAQSRIASLTLEVSSLRSQCKEHASMVDRNKKLNDAVAQLDKAFSATEKKVRPISWLLVWFVEQAYSNLSWRQQQAMRNSSK